MKVREGNRSEGSLRRTKHFACIRNYPPHHLTNSTHHYIKTVCSYGHLTLIYFSFMPRESIWQMGDLHWFSSHNISKYSIPLYLLKVRALNNPTFLLQAFLVFSLCHLLDMFHLNQKPPSSWDAVWCSADEPAPRASLLVSEHWWLNPLRQIMSALRKDFPSSISLSWEGNHSKRKHAKCLEQFLTKYYIGDSLWEQDSGMVENAGSGAGCLALNPDSAIHLGQDT